MDIIAQNNHYDKSFSNKILRFMKQYNVSEILRSSNAYKLKGFSVITIFISIFSAVFHQRSMYFLMRKDSSHIDFAKDTFYRFMNSYCINWRRFMILLSKNVIIKTLERLTDKKRRNVLIIDDTVFDRNRSKTVELLAKIYDHANAKFLKGFRLLTILWSDGNTSIPVNFCLLSTRNKSCRLNEASQKIDHRTNGWKQRELAVTKAPSVVLHLLKEIKDAGISASHVLFDTWFCCPKALINIKKIGFDVVAMTKKDEKNCFLYNGNKKSVLSIYREEKKRPGKSKYLLSVKAIAQKGKDEIPVRLLYVRNRNKRGGYLILITTDMSLLEEEIIQMYGKRWNIEVFFKMCKSYLKLSKECRSVSYDGMTAHTAIVFTRYIFLAVEHRENIDQRSLGELFYVTIDELEDLRYMDALRIILSLLIDQVKELAFFDEKKLFALLDKFIDELPILWSRCLKQCA